MTLRQKTWKGISQQINQELNRKQVDRVKTQQGNKPMTKQGRSLKSQQNAHLCKQSSAWKEIKTKQKYAFGVFRIHDNMKQEI